METDGIDAAWIAVRAAQVDGLDRDGIAALVAELRRVRSSLDAIEVRAVRRLRELEAAGAAESAESLLVNHGGRCGRDARAAGERDELCNDVPEAEDALSSGAVGGEYLDAIAAAAKDLPDDVRNEFLSHRGVLLRRAGRVGLDTFRRECRQLAKHLLAQSRHDEVDELAAQRAASNLKRWIDQQTGMHHTHLELDPVRDARLQAALQRHLKRLQHSPQSHRTSWQHLQVDAFLNAITGSQSPADRTREAAAGDGTDAGTSPRDGATDCHGRRGRTARAEGDRVDRIPEITVVVDWSHLTGQAPSGLCETEGGVPLPVSTVRRLACDAEIIPTVLGGNSELLDHGRSRRTASRAQRRALRALHRTCAHPDCSIGYDWCRLHHIRWWWRDRGPTDIDNLLPLCEQHHHLVHEGRWGLTMTPDRVATWTRPDGTVHHRGTTIDRLTTPLEAGPSLGSNGAERGPEATDRPDAVSVARPAAEEAS